MGVTSLAVGIAGVSWADSPDPVQNSAVGRVIANPAGAPAGAVTIQVEGNWTWPTHRSDCNTNRFAAGYAVDWNDPSDPGPVTLTGKDKQGNPISADPGTTKTTAWTTADPYTHYNGGLSDDQTGGPRCGVYSAAVGYNSGHWGPIEHTYVNPPANITACVVTYDLHDGNAVHPVTGEAGITSKDTLTSAGDNSIQSNGSTPGGNQCAKIVIDHPLSLKVTKTNDANGDGTYNDTETAATAGAAVPFKVLIENTSDYGVTVETLTDTVGGVAVPNALPCVVAGGGTVIGTAIAAHSSTTCTFTAAAPYSPAAGTDKTNEVVVGVAETSNRANTKTASDTSTVHTLDAAADLSVKKTGPATAVADTDAEYTITVTNNGNAAAPAPVTVTDELPAGETYKSATGAVCTVAPGPGAKTTATCKLPDPIPAKVAGQPAPTASFKVTVHFDKTASGRYIDCARIGNSESCWPTDITPDVSLTVDKVNNANKDATFSKSEEAATALQDVDFKATITNPSDVAVTIDSIKDVWLGLANAKDECANLVGTSIPAKGSVTCSFTETGYAPQPGAINAKVNTVTVTGHETGKPGNPTQPATSTSTVTTFVPPLTPVLSILKTGPATAVGGSTVSYDLKVSNTGAGPANLPITVTDKLPVGETYVGATGASCTATAGPGQTVTCQLPSAIAAGASYTFSVQVSFPEDASGKYTDCAKVGNSAESCADTTITPVLTLTVVKTNDADLNGTYSKTEQAKSIGQGVTFRALITNNSKVAVQLDTLTDAVAGAAPFGVCADKHVTLAANGGSVLCEFAVVNYAPAAGSVENTVTVTGHEATNPNNKTSANDRSTVLAPPPAGSPQLVVLKTGPATAVAGSQGTYTIKVSNVGTATANAPLTVTDTLPAGETFVSSSLGNACGSTAGPGSTVVTCVLPQSLAAGADTSFTVTVQFAASASGTLTDCAAIGNSQSCVPTILNKPDLGIVKTGPSAAVLPGDTLTYTLAITNTGPIPVTGFTVTDTLPAGLTLGQLTPGGFSCAAGGAINCTFAGTLAAGATTNLTFTATLANPYALPSVSNTAVVGPNDDTPADNTSTWITPVRQPAVVPPDLGIVKTGPASAKPGEQLVYTLDVTNTGTVPASGFTVTDPLATGLSLVSASGAGFTCTGPGVSCTFPGVLDPGNKVTVTVATMLSSDFDGESIANTATVGPPDETPGDNTDTWITPVQQPAVIEPDLGITKTASAASVSPGDDITYTLTVRNTGLVSAAGFTVSDQLPSGLSLVSISGSGFECDPATVSCTYVGTLAPTETASVTVVTHLSADFTGTSVTDVAVVSPTDGTPEDNQAELTTPVNQPSPPLPFTGSNTYQLLLSALALLSVGAALVLAGRRRHRWEV